MDKQMKKYAIISRLRRRAADSLRSKRLGRDGKYTEFTNGMLFGEYLGYKFAAESVASKLEHRLLIDQEPHDYNREPAAHVELPTPEQSTAEKEAEGRFFSARTNPHCD